MPCPSNKNIFIPKIDKISNTTKTIMIVVLLSPLVSGEGGDDILGFISILISRLAFWIYIQ